MICSLGDCCNANCTDKIVLAISETSEINLSSHIIHPTLVVDALALMPLGIGANPFIVRKKHEQRKEQYKKLKRIL